MSGPHGSVAHTGSTIPRAFALILWSASSATLGACAFGSDADPEARTGAVAPDASPVPTTAEPGAAAADASADASGSADGGLRSDASSPTEGGPPLPLELQGRFFGFYTDDVLEVRGSRYVLNSPGRGPLEACAADAGLAGRSVAQLVGSAVIESGDFVVSTFAVGPNGGPVVTGTFVAQSGTGKLGTGVMRAIYSNNKTVSIHLAGGDWYGSVVVEGPCF